MLGRATKKVDRDGRLVLRIDYANGACLYVPLAGLNLEEDDGTITLLTRGSSERSS
jgi:hypothetical protein